MFALLELVLGGWGRRRRRPASSNHKKHFKHVFLGLGEYVGGMESAFTCIALVGRLVHCMCERTEVRDGDCYTSLLIFVFTTLHACLFRILDTAGFGLASGHRGFGCVEMSGVIPDGLLGQSRSNEGLGLGYR